MSRWHLIAMAALAASPLAAQDTTMIAKPKTTTTLALSDAVAQARHNNPDYRIAQNQLKPAKANVKAAKGAFVPFLGTSAGIGYTGAGQQVIGPGQLQQPSSIGSNVAVEATYNLSGATFFGVGLASANERATQADIASSLIAVDADVVTQYLNGLQAAATTEVARQQLRRNSSFLIAHDCAEQGGSGIDVRCAAGRGGVQRLGG